MRKIQWLLLFLPVAFLLRLTHISDLAVFITSALAIIPLAGTLGAATAEAGSGILLAMLVGGFVALMTGISAAQLGVN